jgi:hypothetical protein
MIMKNIGLRTTLLTCLIITSFVNSVWSQKKIESVSLSFTNNGILNGPVNSLYFNAGGYNPYETLTYREVKIKFDLKGEMQIKKDLYLTGKFGFGIRRDNFDINIYGSKGSVKQNYYDFSVGFLYKFELGKFHLANGFEIPLYMISNYKETASASSSPQDYLASTQVKGGLAVGLNNSTSLRYLISGNCI